MNPKLLLVPLLLACQPLGDLHAAPAVEMQVKWPAGKRLVRHQETTQEVVFSGDALPAPVKQESTQVRDYTLTARSGQELELEIQALKIASTSQGKTMTFDSRAQPKVTGEDPLNPLLRRVVGARVRGVTEADGRLAQLPDYAAWIAKIVAGAGLRETVSLTNLFSEESLKQLGAVPTGLPGKPVQVGDHWTGERELHLAQGLTLRTKTRYTFTGWAERDGRKCAVWEDTGVITANPPAPGAANTIKVEAGKVSGKTWFDPGLGVVAESNTLQEMTLVSSGADGTLTTQFKTKTVNRLVEISTAAKP